MWWKTALLADKYENNKNKNDKNGNMSGKELAEELHKPIIRTFEKRKVHSPFTDNIWGANIADMQLTSKIIKIIRIFLDFYYVLLIFSVNTHWLFL